MKFDLNFNWNRPFILKALVAIVLAQVLILAGEYVNSIYPIWFGNEVRLKTVPVDPRSLFRGNYARLNYDISTVPLPETDTQVLRQHTIIYVSLKQTDKGYYELADTSLAKPEQGIFIRGRLQRRHWAWNGRDQTIKYGIEAFFAPKERALKLEADLRNGGHARQQWQSHLKRCHSQSKAITKKNIPENKNPTLFVQVSGF